jgi:hypothetical protein
MKSKERIVSSFVLKKNFIAQDWSRVYPFCDFDLHSGEEARIL